ncbi:CPBP family intramembrane glutamic endopeptidase [Fructobacillus ficulneus]|uniref:CAAX prenyl protease 2/Lysostaphin resistance protein A-like domain-containing protein n=1 Tax=Fructobacillus ficulneus TaxID=157463 RepID=A0A0K8MK36_9LACO|nr:type II CAAX endopeptidase family protein [Fructobacillus ficulneus]GAP00534.1 hypothetical protein FFIC_285530 [Fructobacillus ficulneus]
MFIKKLLFLGLQIFWVMVLGTLFTNIGQIHNQLLALLAYLGVLVVYGLSIKGSSMITAYVSQTQLRFTRLTRADGLIIIGTYIFQLGISVTISCVGTYLFGDVQATNEKMINDSLAHLSIPLLVAELVFIIVIGPVFEEMAFRGYMMNVFFKNNASLSIIVSTLLFAYLHMHSLVLTTHNLTAFLIYCTLGGALGYAYSQSQKISVSIGLHMLNNLIATIMMVIANQ